MPQTSQQLVERFYQDLWNRRDFSVAGAILAPDFRFRGSLGLEMQGQEAFLGYMRSVYAALSNYSCRIEDMIVAGDRCAARMHFEGVHNGRMFGIEATGRKVSWEGAAFFRIAEGRIQELWVLGGVDRLKKQLGAATEVVFSGADN